MGNAPSSLCSEPKNTQNLAHSLHFEIDPISDENLTNASEIHSSNNWASKKYRREEGILQYNDPIDLNFYKNRVVREEILSPPLPTSPSTTPPIAHPYATVRYVTNEKSYQPKSQETSKNKEASPKYNSNKDGYESLPRNGYLSHNDQGPSRTPISYYSGEGKYKFEQAYVPQDKNDNKFKPEDVVMNRKEGEPYYYQSNLNSSKKTNTFMKKDAYDAIPVKTDLMQTDRKNKDFLYSSEYQYPSTSYSNSTQKKVYERIPNYQDITYSNENLTRSTSSQKPLFTDNAYIKTVSSQVISKEPEYKPYISGLTSDLTNFSKSPPKISTTTPYYQNDHANFSKSPPKISENFSIFSNDFANFSNSPQKFANPSSSNDLPIYNKSPEKKVNIPDHASTNGLSNGPVNFSNSSQKISHSPLTISNSSLKISDHAFPIDLANSTHSQINLEKETNEVFKPKFSGEFKKNTDWMETKRTDWGDHHSDYTFNFNSNASFSPILHLPTPENIKMETVILKRFDSFGELSQKKEYDYENNLFSNKKGVEYTDSGILENRKKEESFVDGMETPKNSKRKNKSRDFSKINGFELDSLDSQTYERIRRDEFLAEESSNEKRGKFATIENLHSNEFSNENGNKKEYIYKNEEKTKFSDGKKVNYENFNTYKFPSENHEKIDLINENLSSLQVANQNQKKNGLPKANDETTNSERLGGIENSDFDKFFRKQNKEKEGLVRNNENTLFSYEKKEKSETVKNHANNIVTNESQERKKSINKEVEAKIFDKNQENGERNENFEKPKASFESQVRIELIERKEELNNSIKIEEERRKSFDLQSKAEVVARSEKLSFLKKKMDQILNQTNELPITPKNELESKNMVFKSILILLLPPPPLLTLPLPPPPFPILIIFNRNLNKVVK